jgi:tRNA threonylcarbamoyladenosine biosynthesis protein TsaB
MLKLSSNNEKYTVSHKLETYKAQIILPLIVDMLETHNLSPYDLDAIEVNAGPGSFTGVRIGVSVANAFAYALQIPINGKSPNKDASLIEPVYTT